MALPPKPVADGAPGALRPALRLDTGTALRLVLGMLFVGAAAVFGGLHAATPNTLLLATAAGLGAYMALNIGANDVANNVGPALGANVLTLGAALFIAAVFEAAGALIAGGEVVSTIRSDIILPGAIADAGTLVWLMMAALLAAALWLNIASMMGAPIATTHAIVGGVLGACVAAGGFAAVNWGTIGAIVVGWVVSPALGGALAAALLFFIKRSITYQSDMVRAACTQVPLLMAGMAWAFSTYLLTKGSGRIWPMGFATAAALGLALAVLVYLALLGAMSRVAKTLGNNKTSINRLFAVPLVFSVALLSFAHGANDVANAIAPLATILDLLSHGAKVSHGMPIPLWVMGIGALGISLGLVLYGPRVIRTVSTGITVLDPMRAYAIAMATALTVVAASQLGMPVSTTHVAVGAILGVGLLREHLKHKYQCLINEIRAHHSPDESTAHRAFLERFAAASLRERSRMLAKLKQDFKNRPASGCQAEAGLQRPSQGKRQELVKRSLMYRIVAVWLVTVPASAAIAAPVFFALRGMLSP